MRRTWRHREAATSSKTAAFANASGTGNIQAVRLIYDLDVQIPRQYGVARHSVRSGLIRATYGILCVGPA